MPRSAFARLKRLDPLSLESFDCLADTSVQPPTIAV
jgi:hypothetical protein